MSQQKRYITVGKFGKPFGVKGYIRVISYTDPTEQLLNYPTWYIQSPTTHIWQPLMLNDKKLHGKGLLVQIQDYPSPEAVKDYTNQLIAIPRHTLPKLNKNEYYWCDLEGLQVINQTGQPLGVIDYLFATPSNDVIVVKGKTHYYIPYLLEETVIEIDLETKQMTVNWPESFTIAFDSET